MTLLEEHAELLKEKIELMELGNEAGLVSIFGEDWDKIGSSGQKRSFGRLFKEAVKQGALPNIEWVRIENSGRYDVYRKIHY